MLVLLLHFSLAVSRLSDQSKVLAQRLALLEQRQRDEGRDGEPAIAEAGDTAQRGAPAPSEADIARVGR